jgi:cobaltochelatase CobT
MDSATSLANEPNYLDRHLRDVLAAGSNIDISAVGVGLDLSVYYDRCTALDLTDGTTRQVLADVLNTIAKLCTGGQKR